MTVYPRNKFASLLPTFHPAIQRRWFITDYLTRNNQEFCGWIAECIYLQVDHNDIGRVTIHYSNETRRHKRLTMCMTAPCTERQNCDKTWCNFTLLLAKTRELRRKQFSICSKLIICLHCYWQFEVLTTDFNTLSDADAIAVLHRHDSMPVCRHPTNKQYEYCASATYVQREWVSEWVSEWVGFNVPINTL